MPAPIGSAAPLPLVQPAGNLQSAARLRSAQGNPAGVPAIPTQPGPRPSDLANVPVRADATPNVSGPSFAQTLDGFVSEVNEAQVHAEQMSSDFAEGRSNDIHGTMLAMQEADVQLRLLGTVRNRALEAYREIMRMGA